MEKQPRALIPSLENREENNTLRAVQPAFLCDGSPSKQVGLQEVGVGMEQTTVTSGSSSTYTLSCCGMSPPFRMGCRHVRAQL